MNTHETSPLPRRTLLFSVGLLLAGILASQTLHAAFQPSQTELIRGGDKPQSLSVDVTGIDDLYLVVTYGKDSYTADQAAWGN